MRRLLFRVGLDKTHLRRWKATQKPLVSWAGALAWVAVVGAVGYALSKPAPADLDEFGNPRGDRYDLVRDNAFDGYTIAVLHLYTGEGFDFSSPGAALRKKGFRIVRWTTSPSAEELARVLETACQLWVISSTTRQLTDQHLAVIKRFFDRGRGIWIWGENEPFYADANFVANALIGVTMHGDTEGSRVVGRQTEPGGPGFCSHPITTGIRRIQEGFTIATIQASPVLDPLIYGSAGTLVAAAYDRHGKRALIDGGFTRLFLGWEEAGSERYVQNAAAWLVNY